MNPHQRSLPPFILRTGTRYASAFASRAGIRYHDLRTVRQPPARAVQAQGPCGRPTGTGGTFEAAMKTLGEIEAAICEGMRRFEQEYMGRGPKDIHAHLIGDLLVVRLRGVLTAAEQPRWRNRG